MATTALGAVLLEARQSLKQGEPERALPLARQALVIDPASILAFFVLGSAHAALSAHAEAAAAFRRVVQLTAGSRPDTQRHNLHVAAAQNVLLESKHALPSSWIAALNDAQRLAAVQQSIQAAVAHFSSPPHVLVCGGMGLEAVMAAQAGAAAVAVLCSNNPLAASLSAELAAASGCANRVVTAASVAELQKRLGPGAAHHSSVLVLADALTSSINWQQLEEQVTELAPLLGTEVTVVPREILIRGCLVHCPPAVALNEVDASALREVTGGLSLEAANQVLPRSSRSVCLPRYQHTALTAAETLLSVSMGALLPTTSSASPGSFLAGAPAVQQAPVQLQVSTTGTADALCWWYEQLLLPSKEEAGTASRCPLSADPGSCVRQDAVLHPHVWQHLEFLNHSQLSAGQQVEVRCSLSPRSSAGAGTAVVAAIDDLQSLSLGLAAPSTAPAAAAPPHDWEAGPQFDVLLAGSGSRNCGGKQACELQLEVPQPCVAAVMPPYHASMLNDSGRTLAYREGIQASLRQAAIREEATAGRHAPAGGEPPLVLDVGSGSGLLSLLACQAGGQCVVGCERVPELNALAEELLQANGMADRVSLVPKLSRQLTVAAAGGGAADMPRRASVLLHEIFGTDPFSEGVVPTLVHAKQHLLQPGATLAPCKLHIVAAVATSASLHRLLRPPASVCGGRIRTGALRELAPQKIDCQALKVPDLSLLTEPCCVLSVDFEAAELELESSSTVLLECLAHPCPLAAWTAAMQAAVADVTTAAPPTHAGHSSQLGGHELATSTDGPGLYVLSWFEIEFAGGITGCSAPHLQRSEHWQQVVQPLEGDAADAVLRSLQPGERADDNGAGNGSVEALVLTAGWTVDRLWFKLEGIAASGATSDDS